MTENRTIENLYTYLRKSTEDEIIVRTSRVNGGWHDNEFDANAAGFDICRFTNPVFEAQRTFSECYRLTRREGGRKK